jgi:hypothetical protein
MNRDPQPLLQEESPAPLLLVIFVPARHVCLEWKPLACVGTTKRDVINITDSNETLQAS